ncbi:helix-turn-helix domain-containing protein [Kordia sp. YSTF-M3]|uniref:Helix-turn-helix domain-containing protein n=1 Tax=Kordia aestuariivivens TaxID=2759037 RepID=A0ABR7Q5K0_9FLAO|nr:helix-turn-helix domain-containing protein [Kordia aestuariivivens]MBC8753834.1 helix-turn-helix domain-containing protein [Kordia aestuariivivens]
MNQNTINLRDIKKMRLERHWSQEQLAEMSGLSIRTIQRIENGENAGLETLKALAAVFETNITDSDKKEEIEQIRKEAAYVEKVKGFYKLFGVAVFSLIVPFVLALNDSENWILFLWILITWIIVIGIYSLNVFDFFGEEWKRKLIEKKFKKKK